MDINMPTMSGPETTTRMLEVLQRARNVECVTIAVTAQEEHEVPQRHLFADYGKKPLSLESVERMLVRHRF